MAKLDPELQPRALHMRHRFEGKYTGEVGEKGSTAPMEVESVMDTVLDLKMVSAGSEKAK